MFLITQNFNAVRSYNPANTYALAIVHLGDRIRGEGPSCNRSRGANASLTLAEVQEVAAPPYRAGIRYWRHGWPRRPRYDAGCARFQIKAGLAPADGYPGLKVLARLRESK